MTVGTPWAIILRLGVSLALFGQEREHLLGDCECWETRFFEQKLQDLAVLPPVATRHGSGRQLHAHQLEDLVLVDGQDRLVVEKRMVVSAHVVRDFGLKRCQSLEMKVKTVVEKVQNIKNLTGPRLA